MANTKFSITIEQMDLSKAQVAAINKEIGAVVMKHVGAAAKSGIFATKVIKNPEWLGIWIKNFATIDRLKASKIPYKQIKLG